LSTTVYQKILFKYLFGDFYKHCLLKFIVNMTVICLDRFAFHVTWSSAYFSRSLAYSLNFLLVNLRWSWFLKTLWIVPVDIFSSFRLLLIFPDPGVPLFTSTKIWRFSWFENIFFLFVLLFFPCFLGLLGNFERQGLPLRIRLAILEMQTFSDLRARIWHFCEIW